MSSRYVCRSAAALALLFASFAPQPALAMSRLTSQALMQDMVRGRVVDSLGNGIAGAVVSLAELKIGTTTDAQGAFAFAAVPQGRYTVVARRIGYSSSVRELLVNGATDLTLRLDETPFQVEPVTVTATRIPTST